VNFFQAQDAARRKTWQLALMFGTAVVTLIILTNILVAFAFGFTGSQAGMTFAQALAAMPADSWLWISVGVVGVVAAASAYKYLSIQAGGRTIAEALGGSLVRQNTQDPKQRQLLNVVEEMAIASGVAVPPVYLIPEPSINAFAAGFGPDDAVIGINQGTLDLLDRDELQGVVAHEFSHILNGDTNINLRLIAILHGILFLGMIGYGLARAGGYSRKNGMPLVALGVGLLVIGYGGTFFGNMIKAAVSRQREYLADASAVQFTRDPTGIADALKKIGGHTMGSTMTSPAAEEASHMFFGAAAKKFTGNIMATHPPLEQRIRAIEPNWDGRFTTPTGTSVQFTHTGGARSHLAGSAGLTGDVPSPRAAAPDVVAQVGTISDRSIAAAQQLIAEQTEDLTHAAHDPFEARALVYAMLIDPEERIARQQLALITQQAEPGVPPHVARLLPDVRASDNAHLLTLLEMTIPTLKELSYNQYKRFTQNAAALITIDAEVDVFEWVLHRLLTKELYPHFEGPQNYHGRIGNIDKVAGDAARLLSILASQGHDDLQAQMQAYKLGATELGIEQPFIKQERFDYQRMNAALGKLRKLKPLVKPTLLKACAATVLADGKVGADEGALLQGIAATLDCPLPPSIYRQTAA
jgi:Zn-dependent protease with chaperone function